MTSNRMKFSGMVSVAAVAALALSACGGTADQAASGAKAGEGAMSEAPKPAAVVDKPTGTITSGVAYETKDYHPSKTTSALAMGTNWHVVEGLYDLNPADGSVAPALAASEDLKKVSDTEYEVQLREGAKFSDGTPVTVDDVVKSFERTMAEGNLYAGFLDFVASVEAKDDKTITFKLSKPFTLVKERLVVARIIPASASDDDMTKMPVGSGPYKYESINEAEIVAVPNEHYNGARKATAEKLVWKILKDDTARTTAAKDGTIDVMESVPADNIELLKADGWTVEEKQGFNLPFMLFNTNKAPFNNAKVRQAFLQAIDIEKLVANNMSGTATPATSFLPESHKNYKKAEVQYTHDVEKAKALLKEAGVENLEITLLHTDHPWVAGLIPQIKNDLEAAGVKVSLQGMASSALYKENLDKEDASFDVAVAPGDPSVFGSDPALLMNWWYGPGKWTDVRTFWAKGDAAKFNEFKAIIDEAVTLEGDAQNKKWGEAQDFISREVPLYPLFHRKIVTGFNPAKVENFTSIATTGLLLLGANGK